MKEILETLIKSLVEKTEEVTITEKEEGLLVAIRYSLEMNYEHISDCTITIKVIDRV